jgi:hypothetical protein
MCKGGRKRVGKPRMIGAFKAYTPNNKMDMRYNRKAFERQKEIADNATSKAELRREMKEWKELERMKREAMG